MGFYFGLACASLLTLANALSIRQPSLRLKPTAEFDNCGFNLNATCDDQMKLFVDGNLLATSNNWRQTSVVHIPPHTEKIEIRCTDGWILGGILAASDNGLITNNAWTCSSDNGTTWNSAHELGANGVTAVDISPDAMWIWTDRPTWTHTVKKRHTTAICKIKLPTSQCCPPFTNSTPTTTPISTLPPMITTTPSPSTPKPGFNLTATCDDKMKLFADGNLLATSSNWRDSSHVIVPANTEIIEIYCIDSGILGGILASSSNGLITDRAWNCSSDNGTTWSPAYEVGPNGNAVPEISSDAEWIWTGCLGDWTSKYTGQKHRNSVICKIDLNPVIDGGWSAWSGFSSCSSTCEDATKARTRTCSNPPPSNGGEPCHGSDEEFVSCGLSPCGGQSCPYTNKYSDCPKWKKHCQSGQWTACMNENCPKTCKCTTDWSPWSSWSTCSSTCGIAAKTRTRTCLELPCRPGITEETASCHLPSCDSIYFIAGGNGAPRDIELYHPTMANLSCSMSPPPLNKNWDVHTTFYYNNTIHLYGGYSTASTCISYKTNMEKWKTHTLTTSRWYGFSSVVLKKRVIIIGGRDSRNKYVGAESTPLPLTDQPVLTPEPNLDYKGQGQCTTKVDEDNLVVTGGYEYNGHSNSYFSSVIEYNAKTRTTTSLPSMKQPRGLHGCAVVEMDNTKWIIVAGGYNSTFLETTEMLQMGESSWTPLRNLNVARHGHSIAVTQSGVMAMGGYDGSARKYLSSVELLDWTAKSWRIVQPSLSKSRYYFGGAVEIPASMFNCRVKTSSTISTTNAITTTTTTMSITTTTTTDKTSSTISTTNAITTTTTTMSITTPTTTDLIYFIAGGINAPRDIELYHPTIANLSCPMSPPPLNNDWYLHTTFYYNNIIHLYGGMRTASTCISYNINTGEWKTHTLTTHRRRGHSSVVLKKRVFIIGGRDSSDNWVGVESTPLPITDQPVLTPVPNLDYKGYFQCTTKVDEDTLVITGGIYNSYLSSVKEYNAKTRTTTSLPSMKQPRAYHGCAVVEMDNTKRIIVAGGRNSADQYLETTEMLQMGKSSWTSLRNLNVGRRGPSIAVTQRGVMAMGGYNGGQLSSVELLDWSAKSWRIVQPSLSKSKSYFGGAVEIPASMFDCRGPVLIHMDSDFKYYKVPVPDSSRMTSSTVLSTCTTHGMKPQCFDGREYNNYNDNNCVRVEQCLTRCPYTLSNILCSTNNPRNCTSTLNMFWYMNNWVSGSACGVTTRAFCSTGKDYTSTSDTQYFAACIKTNQDPFLIHTDSNFKYYKVPVPDSSIMTSATVLDACTAHGMKPQCVNGKEGFHSNDNNCVRVEECKNYRSGYCPFVLSDILCSTNDPKNCTTTLNMFYYMYNWASGSACGVTTKKFCSYGKDYTSTSNTQYFAACIKTNQDWTIIQRREQLGNAEDYFYKDFNEYENGFGSVDDELWIGLKNLAALTKDGEWELRVDLTDWDNKTYHAKYGAFSVGPAPTYKLHVEGFDDGNSTLGDSMAYHNGQSFSARNNDQDSYGGNCAVQFRGGWWYKSCHTSNLNGLNYAKQVQNSKGILWYRGKARGSNYRTWKGSIMKIRKVQEKQQRQRNFPRTQQQHFRKLSESEGSNVSSLQKQLEQESSHIPSSQKLPILNLPKQLEQEAPKIPSLQKQPNEATPKAASLPVQPEQGDLGILSLPGQHTQEAPKLQSLTEQSGMKLEFQLKGKIGMEKVKISVDGNEEKIGLTTEWRLFSYPRPSTGSFSVEFLNDIGYTDVFIRGHESQVTDLLPNFPANKFLGCGTKNEDEKCGYLREGTLMWNGKYTYTLKDGSDVPPK